MDGNLGALFHPPSRIFKTFKPDTLDTLAEEKRKKEKAISQKPSGQSIFCLFLRTCQVIASNVVVIFIAYG